MDSLYVVIAVVAILVVAIVAVLFLRSRKTGEQGQGAAPEAKPETKRPEAIAPPKQPAVPPTAKPTEPVPAGRGEERAPRPERPAEPTAVAPTAKPESIPPIEEIAEEPEAPAPPVPAAPVPTAAPAKAARAESKRDIAALRKGLSQTRGGWVQRLVGLFGGKKELDPDVVAQIEETLLTGDVGMKTTERLTQTLKERLGNQDLGDEDVIWSTLREVAQDVIDVKAPAFGASAQGKTPLVILVVGVNGVGKTTTIGKLASRYKDAGKKVYLAAADTFRAAAVAQLEAWGKRVGVPVVKGKDLSKPSAVVYDAVQTGAREGADVIIADTAGRLHTKTPLMDELRKLRDAASKALPGAPHEILLVLDATTGQNGLVQVKEFREALDLTGIVLTKLDGTAKGGVILGICDEFKLPVRFVGVGEKVDDLREFDAEDFTRALFGRGEEENEAA